MSNLKGITPVIAIIVLLLITVALAGAAWSYLSTYWGTLTAKTAEVTDAFCTSGDTAVVLLRNTGTSSLNPSEITVINVSSGTDPSGTWSDLSDDPITSLTPSGVAKYSVSCSGLCSLRITVGGRAMPVTVQC